MADDPTARAAALASYGILDTPPEREFDDLVALAARIWGEPISLVSLLDTDRQWFKAAFGLDARETEIESAFCAHAVAAGPDVFEVRDATADPRFAGNRLVLGDPNIRFYAGAPMRTAGGTPLGTVCVIDRQPRTLDAGQREALAMLANQAVALLEARRATAEVAVEARRREVALAAAETAAGRFQAAFTCSPVGMLLCDAAGQVLDANGAFAAMLGQTRPRSQPVTFTIAPGTHNYALWRRQLPVALTWWADSSRVSDAPVESSACAPSAREFGSRAATSASRWACTAGAVVAGPGRT